MCSTEYCYTFQDDDDEEDEEKDAVNDHSQNLPFSDRCRVRCDHLYVLRGVVGNADEGTEDTQKHL